MTKIYDFTVETPTGEQVSLQDYAGKTVLIVNTASKCGHTKQFAGLQELYTQFADQGFVILGFPCDQFMNQEFADINETIEFCQLNYGVTFPMFAKIKVNGDDAHPLYKYLKEEIAGPEQSEIEWNFTKFLIDKNGHVVNRFHYRTQPEELTASIAAIL